MPIQLDKILADLAEEKVLHPNYQAPVTKKDIDDAWSRVARKNNLSVHEARSIFKVLQKKYEQEKQKGQSGWKLFPIMDEIHQTTKLDSGDEDTLAAEEDEEYEMLEVQEEEEQQQTVSSGIVSSGQAHSSGGEASDGESPIKSRKSESSQSNSPERFEKQVTVTTIATSTTTNATTPPREEKKLLNSLISPGSRMHSSTAAALQKKGITLKKATPNGTNNKLTQNSSPQQSKAVSSNSNQLLAIGKTIQLPESLKRKISEDQSTTPSSKKQNSGQSVSLNQSSTKTQTVKGTTHVNSNDVEKSTISTNSNGAIGTQSPHNAASVNAANSHHGISLITIPASDVSGSLIVNGSTQVGLSDAANGISSPRIEDIDFRNDIIFDTNMSGDQISVTTNAVALSNGNDQSKSSKTTVGKEEKMLELGISENVLSRNFFKNLCNSTRYESLGLYVANTMNRLDSRAASRLELNILRAIIDAQNESLGGS